MSLFYPFLVYFLIIIIIIIIIIALNSFCSMVSGIFLRGIFLRLEYIPRILTPENNPTRILMLTVHNPQIFSLCNLQLVTIGEYLCSPKMSHYMIYIYIYIYSCLFLNKIIFIQMYMNFQDYVGKSSPLYTNAIIRIVIKQQTFILVNITIIIITIIINSLSSLFLFLYITMERWRCEHMLYIVAIVDCKVSYSLLKDLVTLQNTTNQTADEPSRRCFGK